MIHHNTRIWAMTNTQNIPYQTYLAFLQKIHFPLSSPGSSSFGNVNQLGFGLVKAWRNDTLTNWFQYYIKPLLTSTIALTNSSCNIWNSSKKSFSYYLVPLFDLWWNMLLIISRKDSQERLTKTSFITCLM